MTSDSTTLTPTQLNALHRAYRLLIDLAERHEAARQQPQAVATPEPEQSVGVETSECSPNDDRR